MTQFNLDLIAPARERLSKHLVYESVRTVEDLRVFMQHHVFSVWDFMSLCKTLQNELAPIQVPWAPKGDPVVRRFINEIVLEEETDQGLPGAEPEFASHFELYCLAMDEIGGDSSLVKAFVETAARDGIQKALSTHDVPAPSRAFMEHTFAFIESGKSHVISAAFALGREHIIPSMFRSFLKDMGITNKDAPAFHYYLERHIHLDEDFHAPLSLRMLNSFIADDARKGKEAEQAALDAIEARTQFWDGVFDALPGNQAAAE
ncbi:DUF3050 domain-containing protein [Magnetovibrio sp. PR-2]|uniref:DUF3050 domain-containing protein n=1 Tax=Magnetovibrio sp. PR-2 TaxID=3120356 RepID=UPI002FCDF0D3